MTPAMLVGRRVHRILVAQGEGSVYFDTDYGVLGFSTSADCCSETWFADILGVECLLGQRVTAVEEIALPEGYSVTDGRTRQEFDDVYGFTLRTEFGRATFIYRNSSNGYYGGWLDAAQVECAIPDDAREIRDDWSAS